MSCFPFLHEGFFSGITQPDHKMDKTLTLERASPTSASCLLTSSFGEWGNRHLWIRFRRLNQIDMQEPIEFSDEVLFNILEIKNHSFLIVREALIPEPGRGQYQSAFLLAILHSSGCLITKARLIMGLYDTTKKGILCIKDVRTLSDALSHIVCCSMSSLIRHLLLAQSKSSLPSAYSEITVQGVLDILGRTSMEGGPERETRNLIRRTSPFTIIANMEPNLSNLQNISGAIMKSQEVESLKMSKHLIWIPLSRSFECPHV